MSKMLVKPPQFVTYREWSKGMTDKEVVINQWPDASCFKATQYWPGQGKRTGYIVTRAMHWSGVDGFGATADEAWSDAANRLKAGAQGGMNDL